jgi:hypothetical protein
MAAENRSDGTKADPVRFVGPRGGRLDLSGKFKGARSRPAPNALRLVEDQSLTDQARVYGHAVRCMELIRARELTPCRATGGLKVNRDGPYPRTLAPCGPGRLSDGLGCNPAHSGPDP